MDALLGLFTNFFLSLLPSRWRDRFHHSNVDLKRGAVFSGAVEFVLCGYFFYSYFWNYMQASSAQTGDQVAGRMHVPFGANGTAQAAAAAPSDTVFFLVSAVLLYFVVEGFIRLLVPMFGDRVYPSGPLAVAGFIQGKVSGAAAERAQGPRVADKVQEGGQGFDLRIASCRPKEWTETTTVVYKEGMYQLLRSERGPSPRPHIYLLTKKPAGAVLRGVHNYDPNEVM